ncbi:MAG: phosphomannomutase [Silicimonas sp.]|nr:phosphomannomutase [Silicimonas sp.]
MAPKFGTSGLRGLAVELTDELCARYAAAFCSQHGNNGRLYIGQDNRDSSPRIAAAVAQGAAEAGMSVVDCGVLPTPAMAGAALKAGTFSIMVTGSHIPADRNGLKFYTARGEFTKADEAPLAAAVDSVTLTGAEASVEVSGDPASDYVARYVAGLPEGALSGLKIGVWLHSSAASVVIPQILEGLGAEVVLLGASKTFIPVDTEAVDAEARADMLAWTKDHGLDGIVSTDGDADRPLVVDDTGAVVPGDILGPITARWLGAEAVVTTVSANTMVDLMGAFGTVSRTKIGSPYVIAEMEAWMASGTGKVAGYEPNGGFLLGWDVSGDGRDLGQLMTRDAVLPMVAVFAAARAAGQSLSDLVESLPKRRTATDRLQDVPREASLAIVEAVLSGDMSVLPEGLGALDGIDRTDGVRMRFSSGITVHIRPSGNAPELRCYVEAASDVAAGRVLDETLRGLRKAVDQRR